jgi:hypothetical protein
LETIKINFGYFWDDFKTEDNYFTRILSLKYNVEISEDPDLFFFTYPYNGKRGYLKYKCHRVFVGPENKRADWNICDYVLDSDFVENNPLHKRWPIWAYYNPQQLIVAKNMAVFKEKKKFCCLVVSNGKATERIEFFNRLSAYKKVDSGGRFMNNIGGPIDNKMDFIKDYKFVISFENSAWPGYTTEKLIQPMLVNSIPVYWGNPVVGKDFNTGSFINTTATSSFDAAIERIIELDKDDDKYMAMASQPWFVNNELPSEFTQESFAAYFDFVIQDSKKSNPVASSFTKDSMHRFSLFSNRVQSSLYHRLGIDKGFR